MIQISEQDYGCPRANLFARVFDCGRLRRLTIAFRSHTIESPNRPYKEKTLDCIFCKIITKSAPAEIVFENDRVIVFKDYRPQAKIHLLVCPKVHYRTFLDAPSEEISYLFKVCARLAEQLGVENGFQMLINNGPQGGQIVYHVHVHFMSGLKKLEPGKIEIDLE